jgi:hypothetical protein
LYNHVLHDWLQLRCETLNLMALLRRFWLGKNLVDCGWLCGLSPLNGIGHI